MSVRALVGLVMAGGLWLAAGCGSSPHPDTGAGADQPVPETMNCADLCQRGGACAELLCNEDSHSSRYTGLGDLLASQCEAACSDGLVEANFTSTQWGCMFTSSCREAFDSDYDGCHTRSSYTCN